MYGLVFLVLIKFMVSNRKGIKKANKNLKKGTKSSLQGLADFFTWLDKTVVTLHKEYKATKGKNSVCKDAVGKGKVVDFAEYKKSKEEAV